MFDSLSDRLTEVFRRFTGRGKLTKDDVEAGLREVRMALLEADVNFKVARAFVDRIRERAVGVEVLESLTPGQQIVKIVNDELVALLGGEQRRIRYQSQPPTVVMLVGLQGSGKTTTCAKVALAVRRDGHRPLLVAADTYRPAAAQQLEKLGKDNQVPVVMPAGDLAPPQLCKRGVEEARRLNCDVVILDTAGRLQIDQRMLDEVKEIRKRVTVHDSLLVVDAMTGQEAVNVARAFSEQVGVDGVVLTKLDGDARGGAALSMREAIGVPIVYCGVGEKVGDLEPFFPDRMANRILGMGDVLTLVEKAQEHVDAKQAAAMEEKLLAGRMSMEDFLEQLRAVRRMGPLDSILGMIPGVGRQLKQLGGAMPQERDLDRMEAIVLSMTPVERRRPEVIKGTRRRRIARGSGVTVVEVSRLVKSFEQMQSMMRALGGGGRGTKGMRGKMKMIKNLQGLDPAQLGLEGGALEGASPGGGRAEAGPSRARSGSGRRARKE
ncbi:MAG TPA: signal recognition particle protein [Candidatus Dormibacteraeota bacterium]|nr:signal recognition particle protein [Candidatus Dormibacteraeota bacterium]